MLFISISLEILLLMSLVLVEILNNFPFFYLTTIFYELLTFLSLIVFLRYRIRVGDVTSSIDDGSDSAGLSESNGMYFTTFDRDNDPAYSNCAMHHKAGWWYRGCSLSVLNAPAPLRNGYNQWYTGKKWMNPTSTAMKIRPLQDD